MNRVKSCAELVYFHPKPTSRGRSVIDQHSDNFSERKSEGGGGDRAVNTQGQSEGLYRKKYVLVPFATLKPKHPCVS